MEDVGISKRLLRQPIVGRFGGANQQILVAF